MALIKIFDKELKNLNKSLRKWAKRGFSDDLDKGADRLVVDYKEKINRGVDGAGNSMARVKDSTMNMPIRYGSDPAIRKSVNSSTKPLVARGNMVRSLTKKRLSDERTEIFSNTEHGRKVLSYNAKKAPTKRDPLIVSKEQERILEKEILKGLARALRG